MSNPTASDVHIDAALSDLAIAWGSQQYVWDQLAPVVDVPKQSDKYHIFTLDDFRRDEIPGPRAEKTLAERGEYGLSNDSFYCDDWAWGKSTSKEAKKNADAALNLEQADLRYCLGVVNRRIELQWVSEVFTTSVWDTDITGAASVAANQVIYWSTEATSTPIQDVRAQADAIQKATGERPNRLAMGREVLTVLLDHPDIVDRLPVNAIREVMLKHLAALFEVDEIIVGVASYNSAKKGATVSNSFIWGKNALLYYVPSSPSKDVPSALYSFRWGPRSVLNYEDTPAGKMADVIEVHDYVDVKVTASELGVFFSGIVE